MRNELNPIYKIDGYKTGHRPQYPKGTEKVYTNLTCRSNRHYPQAKDGAIVFGVQYFIKEYLINQFNNLFFSKPKDVIVGEYEEFMCEYLGVDSYDTSHIGELHDLGYLPIKIKSLPEGSIVPIGVPMLTITNTDDRFFWLTNYLETIISNVLWLPITSATTARLYKKELRRHAEKTGFSEEPYLDFLIHDFSMRGMSGEDASITSGMGHLTSFFGSETIPAIKLMKSYYPCNGITAGTVIASEHSVMSAGGDGSDELETYRRFITELYPNGFVSIVSDTYDFWKVMTEYTVTLKDEILSRDGRVVFRPDTGVPEDIICGQTNKYVDMTNDKYFSLDERCLSEWLIELEREDTPHGECGNSERTEFFKYGDKYYSATIHNIEWNRYDKQYYFIEMFSKPKITLTEIDVTPEIKGAYEVLWDVFGGTINEQGYKVLNPKVGIIYGDSITLTRQQEIYKRLEDKGFAATNLVLGTGSYTYQGVTRDSLGNALKATSCTINGVRKDIYKDPKTVVGMPKKSLKGLIKIDVDENGSYYAIDGVNETEEAQGSLRVVFENGTLHNETTLDEIRGLINKTL